MKHKFSKILGVGLTLALLISMLVTAAPVAADAVSNVWVEFPTDDGINNKSDDSGGTNVYIVHFKPATPLKKGVDWVTVTFPDGTSPMGPAAFTVGAVAASEVKFSTNYDTAFTPTWLASTSNATILSKRVKVRLPVDVAAGADVWVKFDSETIKSPSNISNFWKVYVQTTKDTTRKISSAFSLDSSIVTNENDAVTVSTPTAGAASEYIFTFQVGTTQQDTVTVQFPVGTVLPDPISDPILTSMVKFQLGTAGFYSPDEDPVVNVTRRTITATSPIELTTSTNSQMKILDSAGIINPTTAKAANAYHAMLKTGEDAQWLLLDDFTAIVADTATKLAFTSASDPATIVNAYTTALKLELQDVNGNVVDDDATTVLVEATTGTVHTTAESAGADLWGDSQIITDGEIDVFYRPTTHGTGTHVLTASVVTGATTATSATISISVAGAVTLKDADGNILNTYQPSSSNYESDTLGVTYINNAISAAANGDTVELSNGTYELNNATPIALNKKITLKSANGAASTTIKNINATADALIVGIDGTAANPVIIEGLTFERLNSSNQMKRAILNNGYDYVTVRNNIFNSIMPTDAADSAVAGGVVVFMHQSGLSLRSITGGTISGNVFNNCVGWGSSDKPAVINVINRDASSPAALTKVTISDNTLTDSYGVGIYVAGAGTATGTATSITVKDNIITDGFSPIAVNGYTDGVKITGNTVTDGYFYGIRIEYSEHDSLVIKNNTITGSPGAMDSMSAALRIDADGGTGTDPVVQYNAIYDNDATYSIGVATGKTVDAKYNWFGSASGPGTTTLGSPTTTPWLHKSLEDVVLANASYPAFKRSLVVGWNTLSVPAKLMSAANALDELVPTGRDIAYKYSGSWVEVVATDVINPLDGIYIKMISAQTVLLKVDGTETSAPSRLLAAGWNMIGLANLEDMDEYLAVVSVDGSYAQLVSPSINSADWIWIYDPADAPGTANDMVIGESYWIFMKSEATLGGFTILPLVPSLK